MEDSINQIVKNAIISSRDEIQNDSDKKLILSESDFERLLVNKIQEQLTQNSGYVVHTQVSYYKKGYISENELSKTKRRYYQVDIIIMNKDGISPYEGIRKGFKYEQLACVVEVKYLHEGDGNKPALIEKDLKKSLVLCKKGTILWCVTLIDIQNNNEYKRVKNLYKQYRNLLNDKNMLKCVLLYKNVGQIDWIHEE